jgi:nucleotide-binding universal stress UspA family protein
MNPTGSIPSSDSTHRAHPFTQVLIPTDNGPGSETVLNTAFEIAATYGATIHALYVIDTRSELGHWDYVIDQRERQGEQAVETIATRGAEFDIEVVTHIRYGTPHDAICAYADDHDIDLIVMGTHG